MWLLTLIRHCSWPQKLPETTWTERDPGAKVTDELTDEWQQKANQFLQGQLPEHKTKVRKFKRVVGYRHLLSIDHALQTAGSKGLAALQTSSDDWDKSIRELAATRGDDVQPTLSVAADQGGGLFSAFWYLNYVLHICLVIISDLSHRAWNDAKGALKETKLWRSLCMLFVSTLSMGLSMDRSSTTKCRKPRTHS